MFRHRFDRYDYCAGAVIVAAVGLRCVLVVMNWPGTYADEDTLGLMALHIAYQGAHPLLYYGQDYLGSLEAYIGAGLFHFFGPTTVALRLGLLPIFALFLMSLYLLAALIYTKGLALFSIVVVGLGAPDVLLRQLMAAGGTPELFFFTTLLLLLTAWLALTSSPSRSKAAQDGLVSSHESEKSTLKARLPRLIAFGVWGLVAGLDIWSHLLCLPFVLSAAILLVICCRKELRLPVISLLVLCLLLGASPLIYYKATVPVTPNQLSVFSGIFGGGYHVPSYPSPLPAKPAYPSPTLPGPALQVMGTLLVAIPVATNGSEICAINANQAWPLTNTAGTSTLLCSAVHGAWSLTLLALWLVAIISAASWFRRRLPTVQERSDIQRREAVRQGARLMILSGLGLTLLAFVTSAPASASTPWTSARYLVGFLIAMPALLFPLWEMRATAKTGRYWTTRLKTGLRVALLLIICSASLLGTIDTFTSQGAVSHASFSRVDGLIGGLLRLGATHIYADSDDCTRIAFLSDERVICAVLDQGLNPGLDRYFPYRAMVGSWPQPFYVFLEGSPQAVLFQVKATQQHISYDTYKINGYDVFEPSQRIRS